MEKISQHPSEAARTRGRRRMVADQLYFGVEAAALRTGLRRALARLSEQPSDRAGVDARGLAADFEVDAAAGSVLLGALLTGGLVYPDGAGRYRPTRLFREYALCRVVAPLERPRAKALIEKARQLAARINARWDHVPFRIESIAVSGDYMSSRQQLTELSLSLTLSRRPATSGADGRPVLADDEALHELCGTLHELSSFVAVRVVADRQAVPRPFGIVFEAAEPLPQPVPDERRRVRNLGASIGRWLAFR